MNIGKACAIFEQIQKEKYSDNEKLWAIKDVLDMPTHNGITKDTILNTFKWFFDYAIEEAQEESTKPEVQTRWIPVSERLPEERDSIFAKLKGTDKWKNYMFEKTSTKVIVTICINDGSHIVTTAHTIDGRWKTDIFINGGEVIAWMPLPEPWKGERMGQEKSTVMMGETERIKVSSLDIIVTMIGQVPYYEIKYKEIGESHYNIGYSSYELANVLAWKDECFELVENGGKVDGET